MVTYLHDEDTAAAGMTLHVLHGEPAWRRWFLRVAALYLLVMAGFCLSLVGEEPWMALLALVFLAAAALAAFGRRRLAGWRARRHHRRRPDADRQLTVRIHEDGVDLHVADLAEASFSWAHMTKAVVAPEALLLYVTSEEYIHLPRPHLEGDPRERVVRALRERVRDVRAPEDTAGATT